MDIRKKRRLSSVCYRTATLYGGYLANSFFLIHKKRFNFYFIKGYCIIFLFGKENRQTVPFPYSFV